MDLNQKIIAALVGGFLLIALLRVFRAPLRLAFRLAVNTLLGFAALWAVHATAGITGIAGPGGGTPEKPVGTVVVGAFAPGWRHVTTLHLHGSRQTIRQRSAAACIQLLIRGLLRLEP